MINRTRVKSMATPLGTLLMLWHGDAHTTGWASATLACEVARLTKPANSVVLGETIYGSEDAIPKYDKEIVRAINEGYARYRGYEFYCKWKAGYEKT